MEPPEIIHALTSPDNHKAQLAWQIADKDRTATELLIKHIDDSAWWVGVDQATKEKYVRDFMAPLVIAEAVCNDIT